MDSKIISHGAEAKIFALDDYVLKYRIKKSYRIPELDSSIIKKRTKKEQKILKKLANECIPVPKLFTLNNQAHKITPHFANIFNSNNTIVMERIQGITVAQYLKDKTETEFKSLLLNLGALVARIHECNVIHGDITLNNFIVGDKLYAIDFGLSFISTKDEDKAVDLYVFERALSCTYDYGIEDFYIGYNNDSVMKRLEKVRLRGRKREENALDK